MEPKQVSEKILATMWKQKQKPQNYAEAPVNVSLSGGTSYPLSCPFQISSSVLHVHPVLRRGYEMRLGTKSLSWDSSFLPFHFHCRLHSLPQIILKTNKKINSQHRNLFQCAFRQQLAYISSSRETKKKKPVHDYPMPCSMTSYEFSVQ